MALFANVANRSNMNSLRMARPSRHESVYTRKIKQKIKETKQKYDVQAIQSLSGQTVRRGGDPQRDWMRWRQPKDAILDLLTPEARKQMVDMNIRLGSPGEMPYYSPSNKLLNIPSGVSADYIRHELTHAGLHLAPKLFPDVPGRYKFASSLLGGLLGHPNSPLSSPNVREGSLRNPDTFRMRTETPAITMGGAEAYPGYTPAFKPEQFSNFFDVEKASWQYSEQPGWTIGK